MSVPQLGTFSIQQRDSRWVAEEDLFLPPVRNVAFSREQDQAAADFIQSLAVALRLTSEQAQAACAEYVENMRQELAANSVAEVGSIGMFVRDSATGTDCFLPCQAGVTSPDLYGLDSIYQPRLPESVRQSGAVKQPTDHAIHRDDKHVTIRIPRSLLYYATAAAAAIIVFLSFSTPAIYTSPEVGTTVAATNLFLPSNLLPSVNDEVETISVEAGSTESEAPVKEGKAVETVAKHESTHKSVPQQPSVQDHPAASKPQATESQQSVRSQPKAQPVQMQQPTQIVSAPVETTPTPSQAAPKPQETQPQAAPQGGYAVVLASAVTKGNAERYVQDLNKRGIKAEMRAKGSMTRVVVPGFSTQDEAYSYVREIRAQGSEFDAAWVLKL